MELVIHGTNGGYGILHTTNRELARSISRDVRKGAQGDEQLGKAAYSLAFVANGCVYSKYVIVKDSIRSFATGTIALSLFMGTNETMKAEDILKLLNELYDFYESNYIKNHYLNRGETELIREDWSFVNEILSKYKTEPKTTRHEDINSGTQDAAIIYYQDENELLEYFDKPFQVEYSDYSQILLIQSNLQGITNPIHVLKNSGVELKNIDLKNKYYYLNNYNRSKGITITANDKPRSEGKNNNSIRAKDIIEIYYSKDEQCYEPIHTKGPLFSEEVKKYLEVRNNDIIINYGAFENPEPIKRMIHIEVRHRKGSPVNDVEVVCRKEYSSDKKIITENKVEFSGTELKERWSLLARVDDTLFSETKTFVPAQQNEKIILTLEEHKWVSVNVANPELNKNQIRISIRGIKNQPTSDSILFVGNEIETIHNITISASGYDDKSIPYNPQNNQPIQITLQKKKRYKISAGEYGEKTSACPSWSDYIDGSDIDKKSIKPYKGYVFTKWELNDKEDTLVAQYSKKKAFFLSPKVIAGMATLLLVLGVGTWFLFLKGDSDSKNSAITENDITTYVDGDELLMNTLNNYKTQWEQQKPKEKSAGIFGMLGFGKKETDSTAYKNWEKTHQHIERAIKKRRLLDSKDFKVVLDSSRFSNNQQSFKSVLQKMDSLQKADSLQYGTVKDNLGDISSLKLSDISDKINEIITSPAVNNTNEITGEKTEQQKKESENDIVESPKVEEKKQTNVTGQTQGSTNKNNEITQYLKGGELKKETLENYKNVANQNLKKSIDLALEFWSKINNNQKSDFDDLLRRVKSDGTLKNSELKKFLDKICENSKAFQKFNSIPGKATIKTIDALNKKFNESN